MRILAVWGTPFETTVKTMYNSMLTSFEYMKSFVKDYLGVEPRLIDNITHCGIVCHYIPVFDFYIDDRDKLDPKIIRQDKRTKEFVPNLRTKKGKQFYDAFNELAISLQVTDKPLHEFGIRMLSDKTNKCYSIFPTKHYRMNIYYLVCSDDIKESFGNDLKRGQMILM